ncbi:MAG: DUF6323 family protein [Lachnospiraceae bacterium]|nr:DUF6323 family protein [Lachnospiraceae bacterium]
MEQNWIALMQQQNQLAKVMETNEYTQRFGLSISKREAELLVAERKNSLTEQRRVEFGAGILPKIIHTFCDSDFIEQDNYVETLTQLQDIFYLYKNEMMDEITDDELLQFMREKFDKICFGDLDYLSGTCLSKFAEAIRSGYNSWQRSDGYGKSVQLDDVERWDYKLYMAALEDLF